jgi:hypothetical protein
MSRMGHDHWIPESEWPKLIERVCAAQADMEEPARSRFSENDIEPLGTLIRLTIEFDYYLRSKRSVSPDQERFVCNYVCDSILGGVESFRWVADRYQGLIGAIHTKSGWESVSGTSATSFNEKFFAMFEEFAAEPNFENKCRLLLDLFKLQILFSGISYD